jgi:hypothetical protein
VVGARDLPERIPFPDNVRGVGKQDGGDRRGQDKRDEECRQSFNIRNYSPFMSWEISTSIPRGAPKANIKFS